MIAVDDAKNGIKNAMSYWVILLLIERCDRLHSCWKNVWYLGKNKFRMACIAIKIYCARCHTCEDLRNNSPHSMLVEKIEWNMQI